MIKKLPILVFLMLTNTSLAQDWNAWGFAFQFKIDTESRVFKVTDWKIYINDPHYSMNWLSTNKDSVSIERDSITNEYRLTLKYGCVSCGYGRAYEPPDLYISAQMENHWGNRVHSLMIPVYLDQPTKNDEETKLRTEYEWVSLIELGEIKLAEFVDGYTVENGKTLPPFEAIRVKRDRSVIKLRSGEYTWKRMDKLVELKREE